MMNQLKRLQETLKSLRLGEAADYLPDLLEKSKKRVRIVMHLFS